MCGSRLGSHRSQSLGCCSFPLLCCNAFSNVRVGVRQRGPELAGWGWAWTHLTFHLQKGLIFLMIVGWQQSLVLHGVHLITCIVWSLLNIWVPCMDVIFTSTSTTSIGSLHLKKLCRKLHLGLSKHAISLKCEMYILVILFLLLSPNYTMLSLVLSSHEDLIILCSSTS